MSVSSGEDTDVVRLAMAVLEKKKKREQALPKGADATKEKDETTARATDDDEWVVTEAPLPTATNVHAPASAPVRATRIVTCEETYDWRSVFIAFPAAGQQEVNLEEALSLLDVDLNAPLGAVSIALLRAAPEGVRVDGIPLAVQPVALRGADGNWALCSALSDHGEPYFCRPRPARPRRAFEGHFDYEIAPDGKCYMLDAKSAVFRWLVFEETRRANTLSEEAATRRVLFDNGNRLPPGDPAARVFINPDMFMRARIELMRVAQTNAPVSYMQNIVVTAQTQAQAQAQAQPAWVVVTLEEGIIVPAR